MAPKSAPHTPTPSELAYAGFKSPAGDHVQEPSRSTTTWTARYRVLGLLAQLLVVGSIATYVFGQLYVFTNGYNNGLRVTLNLWWGVPYATALTNGGGGGGQAKGQVIGHAEMVRPTFVFLFFVLPMLAIAVLVEFLRCFNVRRLSSSAVLQLARVLRRKPHVAGKVSYWSYGEWLFVLGFLVLGNVLAFYYGYSRRLTRAKETAAKKKTPLHLDDYLDLVGVTLGFNAIYNLAFLFLPATRNSAWLEFLNISYANAIKYHRWLGIITVSTAVIHCATFYWLWIREGVWKEEALPCFDCPLDKPKGQGVWFNVFGELALLCFLAIAFTSMPFVRRRFYNVFYFTHQLLFLAVVFAVMHWGPIVWWILPSFVVYLFGRAISSSNAMAPGAVKELTALSPNLIKVVIHRGSSREGHYKVGQFLYLNVPAISKLQWHAFTIASSPRSSPTTVTVLLKSLGDWTGELVHHAEECKAKNVLPTVYVDGFYGASLELYDEYSTLVLVAGGIGVTPILAILDDLACKLSNHETLSQKVVFIFSFRELALLEEVAGVLTKLRELDPQQQFVAFHLTMTRTPTEAQLDSKLRPLLAAAPPTQYDDGSVYRRAFAQPLQSPRFKALAYGGIFFVALVLVVYLEFGHAGFKIKREGARLWPLQQFTEIAVVLLSALVVVAVVTVERVATAHARALEDPVTTAAKEYQQQVRESVVSHRESSKAFLVQALQVQTYRDLLSEFSVVVGDKPAVASLLRQVYEQQQPATYPTATSTIGVFASGPESLKRTVEVAIASIDSSGFDLHEEQFEL